uniref:ABC transporter domain-containing protein n=1 Tax=Rhodnius prolixus TaxID=13249 RepID=T1HDR8_RHOPR
MDDSGCTAATMEVESTRMEELPMQIREQITFTRLPATEPVEIRFQDLQYRASLGFRKGTKEILHNVHGRFLPAQLIAIMGPSGAGKSTLLDVLSGYRITGVRGVVTINGRERDLDEFRRVSCYITQDDRLQPLLTVRENMKVAADLKLTARYSELEKFAIPDYGTLDMEDQHYPNMVPYCWQNLGIDIHPQPARIHGRNSGKAMRSVDEWCRQWFCLDLLTVSST